MNHLCSEKLQLTTLENSINHQSAERIGKEKHGGRTPAAKSRSRNKSFLTQSIRNIEEELGRVPTPLSTAGGILAWRSWWVVRENKASAGLRNGLYHTVPWQVGPKWPGKGHRGRVNCSKDCQCLSCSTSTVSIPTASSNRPRRGFPRLFLGLWKGYFILAYGDTFSQLLSAISIRTGGFLGAALSLLSRQQGNDSLSFTPKRWGDRNNLQPF